MKNKISYRSEQLPFRCENLENPKSYFISKQLITLKYTENIRNDIKSLMLIHKIKWKKLCEMLSSINYRYNPNSLQNQVNGNTKTPRDISYFIPILLFLMKN